jgi:hypothetical protein
MKAKFFLFLLLVAATQMKANNMLVKNVTTTGNNATNKTIQVQFDMSWDNSWRDGINWDAAWVFMKYKDANGLWQHVQLNTTGFANGTGTANTIQVGSDKVGAFVYRAAAGTGTFASTTMQLQWNYGLSGLTNVTGLEIRVFAVEMVYVPQGDFNVAKNYYNGHSYWGSLINFKAPGDNFIVINTMLTPTLSFSYSIETYNSDIIATSTSIRIKGDAGIDTNNDGVVDNTTYPTGYKAFYSYKYEMSEQQYADFLNTLNSTQITTLGLAGVSITPNNGQYFSSTPNKACGNSDTNRLFAYADWSGLRPMTILEFNKVAYAQFKPIESLVLEPPGPGYYTISPYTESYRVSLTDYSIGNLGDVGLVNGKSYYGNMDIIGNAMEPIVTMNSYLYSNINGNGNLNTDGTSDISSWNNSTILYIDTRGKRDYYYPDYGFRYVRSAE